ncbi:MAG: EamA family transporter [Tannerellaceae bacterium]|jgi:drug/metabolite transporter (DMT)-like permease|nr:EamA family transporter [Tannerellaceae bacterium]
MNENKKPWLFYALLTTIFWGVWGAFIEIPEKAGFPATLGYVVWVLTMIPVAIVALINIKWKLNKDFKSIVLGLTIGLFGAGGQLLLFEALTDGPAYIVFPFIGLYPVLTIILSVLFLREKAAKRQWFGIVIAMIAALVLSYQKPSGITSSNNIWLIISVGVFICWGLQNFVLKFANNTMKAESIFFYEMAGALLLIPVAFFMTDFSQEINRSFSGPCLAAIIHVLNSIGALTFVYAIRHGKAIVVVPMLGITPKLITIVLSLIIYSLIPGVFLVAGIILAIIAILLMLE